MEPEQSHQQPPDQNAGAEPVPPILLMPGECLFQRVDWLGFALTTVLALAVYLFTLAPEVTLEMSGMLATAANYGGVAHPPGFPVWTAYAWLFTKVLPFSNIAWRVGVSSAVAGALTCGMIALLASRLGAAVLQGLANFRRSEPGAEYALRLVGGTVAGMGFGFNNSYWLLAVTVETKPLTIALLTLTVCLLSRWSYEPEKRRYLYAGFLVYGLSVSASPIVMPAALALPFFVMFFDSAIAREMFFCASLIALAIVFTSRHGWLPLLEEPDHSAQTVYFWIGILTAAMWLVLILRTRRAFTRWRPALAVGCLSLVGVLPYLTLPLAAMTTPPSNWGYARSVEGFFHLVRRGQFQYLSPAAGLQEFVTGIWVYVNIACKSIGWPYLLAAIVPFYFLFRMGRQERRAMLGMASFYMCLTLLVLYLLCPFPDKASEYLLEVYFTPSFVFLTMWSGLGLILLGTVIVRSRKVCTDSGGVQQSDSQA